MEDGGIAIYYTLCGNLPKEICDGAKVAACLKDKEYRHIIGKQFILGIKWTSVYTNTECSYIVFNERGGGERDWWFS